VVEWSWDLLDDSEQVLARRLTVFVGGGTLEAAERVCGLPAHEVVDVLTGLVDKSLVEAADGRYRMLDTIRAFCAERLAEAGEADALRRAHAAYFLNLAQVADPHLRRAEQLEWLRRLDAERDNLHTALRRALASRTGAVDVTDTYTGADTGATATGTASDIGTAMRLVAALSFYWWVRGLRSEGAALAGEILTQVGAEPPPGLYEEFTLCVLTASLGDQGQRGNTPLAPQEAQLPRLLGGQRQGSADSVELIIQKLGGQLRQPFLLFLAAMAGGPPADDSGSVAALVDQWQSLIGPNPWLRGLSALGLGLTCLFDGQFEQAQREFSAALGDYRAIGDRWGTLMVLGSMAELDMAELDYERDGHTLAVSGPPRGNRHTSHDPLDEALRLAGELDSTIDMADLLRVRGEGYVRTGKLEAAHADYERAAELARRSGAPEMAAAAHAGLGEIARVRGDLAEARRLCEAALAECPAGWFSADTTRFDILVALGRITDAAGDTDAARTWYHQALAATGNIHDHTAVAQAVAGLAGVELAGGDGERAALLLGAATVLLPDSTTRGAVDVARAAATAKAVVGEAAYSSAYRRGAAMTRAQALAVLAGHP
jgi:tetratricopeptide (TPR) repeat protein